MHTHTHTHKDGESTRAQETLMTMHVYLYIHIHSPNSPETQADVFTSRAGDAPPNSSSSPNGRYMSSSACSGQAEEGGGGGRGGCTAVKLEVSKTEWMVWLELSPLQKHLYRQFLDSGVYSISVY